MHIGKTTGTTSTRIRSEVDGNYWLVKRKSLLPEIKAIRIFCIQQITPSSTLLIWLTKNKYEEFVALALVQIGKLF
ncbi:hypothetical protein BX070DRAFT_219527 [Coemansia spiralis]|nr:hypothetical protein BX070DRAFT_219527 [Coemansia spiralis]